jgi:type IV pilus assembly protein PilE
MKNKGFNLVELMILVAVIGVVTAMAYPSYKQYVLTSNRIEARAALMELSQIQENYYVENGNRYATALGTAGLNAGKFGFESDGDNFTSKNANLGSLTGYYKIYFTADGNGNGKYKLAAEITGNQVKDISCSLFTIDQAGRRIAKDSEGEVNDKCW